MSCPFKEDVQDKRTKGLLTESLVQPHLVRDRAPWLVWRGACLQSFLHSVKSTAVQDPACNCLHNLERKASARCCPLKFYITSLQHVPSAVTAPRPSASLQVTEVSDHTADQPQRAWDPRWENPESPFPISPPIAPVSVLKFTIYLTQAWAPKPGSHLQIKNFQMNKKFRTCTADKGTWITRGERKNWLLKAVLRSLSINVSHHPRVCLPICLFPSLLPHIHTH